MCSMWRFCAAQKKKLNSFCSESKIDSMLPSRINGDTNQKNLLNYKLE